MGDAIKYADVLLVAVLAAAAYMLLVRKGLLGRAPVHL